MPTALRRQNGFEKLPANFQSTANAIEMLAFSAKDAIFVCDDFAPQDAGADVARYYATASRLLRAVGNNQGRMRLKSDATMRDEKAPRGLVMITGEDVPRGQSIRARALIVDVKLGDIGVEPLTEAQAAGSAGNYSRSTAAFIRWITDRGYDEVVRQFRARAVEHRILVKDASHPRTPGIVAELHAAFELFTEFAVSAGAINERGRANLISECWSALCACAV